MTGCSCWLLMMTWQTAGLIRRKLIKKAVCISGFDQKHGLHRYVFLVCVGVCESSFCSLPSFLSCLELQEEVREGCAGEEEAGNPGKTWIYSTDMWVRFDVGRLWYMPPPSSNSAVGRNPEIRRLIQRKGDIWLDHLVEMPGISISNDSNSFPFIYGVRDQVTAYARASSSPSLRVSPQPQSFGCATIPKMADPGLKKSTFLSSPIVMYVSVQARRKKRTRPISRFLLRPVRDVTSTRGTPHFPFSRLSLFRDPSNREVTKVQIQYKIIQEVSTETNLPARHRLMLHLFLFLWSFPLRGSAGEYLAQKKKTNIRTALNAFYYTLPYHALPRFLRVSQSHCREACPYHRYNIGAWPEFSSPILSPYMLIQSPVHVWSLQIRHHVFLFRLEPGYARHTQHHHLRTSIIIQQTWNTRAASRTNKQTKLHPHHKTLLISWNISFFLLTGCRSSSLGQISVRERSSSSSVGAYSSGMLYRTRCCGCDESWSGWVCFLYLALNQIERKS